MQVFAMLSPLLIAVIFTVAAVRRVDIVKEFCEGASEGLRSAAELIPTLLLIVTAVSMLYRSGTLSAAADLLSPVLSRLGYPSETVPLALIRPVSGSGALAVFENIIGTVGADSPAGRAAAILMGSTETTFYTIAVYFSAVSFKPDKRVFISSLTADAAGFVFSGVMLRIFYPI